MKKLQHYDIPFHAHELTFSCYQRQPLLASNTFRQYLADAMSRARRIHSFHIWAYVFMPEHVHLLIWPTSDEYSISKILLSIKLPVAQRAVLYLKNHDYVTLQTLKTREKRRPYRFWQAGGGYDRNVTSLSTLGYMVDYLHHNPMRRGLVKQPEEWVWSSYTEWKEPGSGPIPVDRESFPVL